MRRLLILCAALLGACASSTVPHGRVPEAEASEIFRRFSLLQPPITAASARRALGDPSWMRRVGIIRQHSWQVGCRFGTQSGRAARSPWNLWSRVLQRGRDTPSTYTRRKSFLARWAALDCKSFL